MITGLRLPDAVARCVDPGAPEAIRLLAARGGVPLPPVEALASLALLMHDPSKGVREAARTSWIALPGDFVDLALADPHLPTEALDLVEALRTDREHVLYRILEHPALGPGIVSRHVESEDEEVLVRLAANQRLLDEHRDLALRLLQNPLLPPAEKARLVSLYAHPEAGQDEPFATDAETVVLPPDLPAALIDDAANEPEPDSKNLYQLVQSLSVAEKIKLATLGSKSARRLLIRDTNRVVQAAVIRSPKMREDDVLAVVQDRTVSEEVVRIVLTRKDWLKSYPIRLALCQNPKTPIPRALRLLETLQERDLRQIGKNRNVPGAVSSGALRVLSRRGKI